MTESDPVLVALDGVLAALELNARVGRDIARRAKALRNRRAKGLLYREIVPGEERPLIVELLRANQERLALAGAAFRRTEAAALRAEGLTLDQIAAYFGVTRPRVVALLREAQQMAATSAAADTAAIAPKRA